jgi:hypothetical protein
VTTVLARDHEETKTRSHPDLRAPLEAGAKRGATALRAVAPQAPPYVVASGCRGERNCNWLHHWSRDS